MGGDIAKDMMGFRSGKLAVISQSPTKEKRAMWLCMCDCGNTRIVMGKYLRRVEVKSCGCLHRQPLDPAQSKVTHGHTMRGIWTRTYRTWSAMISRCHGEYSSAYYKYGAKGITVCEKWHTFKNFLEDMGERPEGKTIDRIDNAKGYEPGNCRWSTLREQMQNQTKTRFITFSGETHCLTEWSRILGISPTALFMRLNKWPIGRAMLPGKQKKGAHQ